MLQQLGKGSVYRLAACLLVFCCAAAHGNNQPLVGLAKSASDSQYLGDNTFSTEILLTVKNMGFVRLTGMSVKDDLKTTFAERVDWFEVEPASLHSDHFIINRNFNGSSDQELLASGSRLKIGQTASIRFQVRFRVTDGQGTFYNSAYTESIERVSDDSTDGTDPDPNGDRKPIEAEPTPIKYAIPSRWIIGLAKRAAPTEHEQDHTFVTELLFELENLGNQKLHELQITDDLAKVFENRVADFEVVTESLQSAQLKVNSAFDGSSNLDLLASGNSLAVGESAQVSLQVRFTTLDDAGRFDNTAFADCTNCTTDRSTDGPDTDPNHDGDPIESVDTPITYELPSTLGAQLGLAKTATFGETTQDNERETTIHLFLHNYGNATALDIDIQDDLTPTFEAALPFTVQPNTLSSSELQVNANYDGNSTLSLLSPGQSLAPGASATLSYQVRFEVTADTGEIFNQATASATNSDRDDSTNGENPDINGDGLPQEHEPTPIPYTIAPPEEPKPPEPPKSLDQLPLLQIDVTPKPRTTRVGRVVGYSIRVANTITDSQPAVVVTDLGPEGFQPQLDKVLLVRTGADGLFDTTDDVRRSLGASGNRLITYQAFPLAALEAVRIEFPSRVTSAARLGPHPNKSTANSPISSQVVDDAIVNVIADVLFSRATIIGKVFRDLDGNGLQNSDGSEQGVAAARLITAEGLIIHTDNHGRYHIVDIEVNGRFGENYAIKLDVSSLPLNAVSISDPRQIVRVVPGGIGKANFAVKWADRSGKSNCCGDFEHLDQLSLIPGQKKLDVALQTIRLAPKSAELELNFLVTHNYPDTVQCLQMAIEIAGAPNPADFSSPATSLPIKSIGTRSNIQIQIPPQPFKQYGYSVFAYHANHDGQCDDLLSIKTPTPQKADSTLLQYFETPASNARLPIILPTRALNTSLKTSQLYLPPVIPQLKARKFNSEYQMAEVLTSDPARVVSRTKHDWEAIEPRRSLAISLTPGNSLETTGYQLPAQVGGAVGTVTIARDSNGFSDQVVFAAAGRNASLTCCEIDTTLSTSLDTTSAVYALKFKNQHTAPLDLCLLPDLDAQPSYAEAEKRCWHRWPNQTSKKTVAAGNSIEIFQGQFITDRPMHNWRWNNLYLFLRESDTKAPTRLAGDFIGGYRVSRERTADGIWTQPKVAGICGDVSSDIDITRSVGVAAHKLRSEDKVVILEPTSTQVIDNISLANDLYLGIVDLTLGGSSARGDLASLAEHNSLDDDLFAEGRIAGYWRGHRVVGSTNPQSLNWVLQLDTTKDEFSSLRKNLSRKDPRRLFRQLDVDRYYPTYGDDSTTFLDTNTQGAMYARVKFNHSEASWGNYRADFSDSEFSHFTRTLYGLNATHQSNEVTADGEHKLSVRGFASEAQSVSAHTTFLATGGSLYYLKHTDIVMGSERLWVEIRRRGTQQLDERTPLVVGRDYEIDPLQGRVILSRPLAQLVREQHNPVIRRSAAEGDQVHLRVDYEYAPQGFSADEFTYGLRAKNWVTNSLRIGATHVTDQQGTSEYSLYGVDLLYRPLPNSYIALDWADTQADNYQSGPVSLDGGLSLLQASPASLSNVDGQAFGVDALLSLADLGIGTGSLRAWRKQRDAGYASSRFSFGPKVVDTGFDFDLSINPTLRLTGAALELDQQGVSRTLTARVQLSKQWLCAEQLPCWMLDLEGRYDNGDSTFGSLGFDPSALYDQGRGTTIGIRLGRQLNPNTTVYGNVQTAFATDTEFGSGDLLAAGLNQRLNDSVALSIEVSDGHNGGALTGGIDYLVGPQATFNLSTGVGPGALTQASTRYHLTDGQELYGSYTMSPDRSDGARNMLALGQRRQMGQRTHIYSESQFGHQGDQTSSGHLFGIDWRMADNLVLATTLHGSRVQTPVGDFDRLALSVGASYASERIRFSSRVELREDDGISTQAKQYVISNALNYRISDSARLQGKLNAALVEDDLLDTKLGRFIEFDLGYAYRPTQSDRLNSLLRYSFLLDVGTQGQSETLGDERTHLFGAEGFVEASQRVQIGAKLAARAGASRFTKGQGSWDKVKLGMAIARILIRFGKIPEPKIVPNPETMPPSDQDSKPQHFEFLPNRFELQAEYRWLKDWEGQTLQKGMLLGVFHTRDSRNQGWKLSNTLRFGVGYNFSGFNDNLRRSRYRSSGWFIDFAAAF